MSFVPDPLNPAIPIGTWPVSTAAEEFRLLKQQNLLTLQYPASDLASQRGLLPPAAVRAGRFLSFNPTTGVPEAVSPSTVPVGSVDAQNVAFLALGAGAVLTSARAKFSEVVNVRDFGAVGDGVTNDTLAFNAACARITALGGGTLVIPFGTYILGRQTFAGASGLGYAYRGEPMISFNGLTRPLIIEGNGSTLKLASGMRFGSFDPVTGVVFNPVLPFYDHNFVGQPWNIIDLVNCVSATVRDLEIDGNIQELILGGQWGDVGWQLHATGIRAYENRNLLIENVHVHHCGLDGLIVGFAGLTELSEKFPTTLINYQGRHNARHAMAVVGTTQLTAINSKFNSTGRTRFVSPPGAGVNFEAEESVCRNGLFINCEFQDNANPGFVADTGDVENITFLGCKFVGQHSHVIWPRKPNISFIDCLIVGSYANPFASTTRPQDATKFIRCIFSDEVKYASTLFGIGGVDSLMSGTTPQNNVLYDTCTFINTRSKPGRFDSSILRNTTFNISVGTTVAPNQTWLMILSDALIDNVTVNDFITVNIPADAYMIELSPPENLRSIGTNIVNSAGKIRWYNWSWGHTGLLYNSPPGLRGFRLGTGEDVNTALITWGTAVPTTGTWVRGSRVINTAPSVGQPRGWACTVTGTPGTWVSEGNL